MSKKWVGQATSETLAAVRDENFKKINQEYSRCQEFLNRMKKSPQINRMMEDAFHKTSGQSFPYMRISNIGIGFNFEKRKRYYRAEAEVRFKDYDIEDIHDLHALMAFVEFVGDEMARTRGHIYRAPVTLTGCGTHDIFTQNGFSWDERTDSERVTWTHHTFLKYSSIDASVFSRQIKQLRDTYNVITTTELDRRLTPNLPKPIASSSYAILKSESFWEAVSLEAYVLNSVAVNWNFGYQYVELECSELLPKDDKIYRW